MNAPGRRPLATRQAPWARNLAARLAALRVSPNAISATSLVFAVVGGAAFACALHAPDQTVRTALLAGAAVAIQFRLLCNLLDGLVAVEGGLKSPTGELWNEVPDRLADTAILVGAGLAVAALPAGAVLGWAAAAGALLTAYIRALGASLGSPPLFHGPQAKPQRMAVLTVAAIAAACLPTWWTWILWTALVVITSGTIITSARRLRVLAHHLRTPCSPT